MTEYAVGDMEPLPENPSELAALSGMPEAHQNRVVGGLVTLVYDRVLYYKI